MSNVHIFSTREILYSQNFNLNNQSIYLLEQPIDTSVVNGDLVYYDTTVSEWITSVELTPQGIYSNGVVYLFGIVHLPSMLSPRKHYYMDSYGKLTTDIGDMYSGICIGFSLTDSLLLLNINIIGDNTIQEKTI